MSNIWAAVAGEIGDDEVLGALFGPQKDGKVKRLLARIVHPHSDDSKDVMDWYETPEPAEYVKISEDYGVDWTATC